MLAVFANGGADVRRFRMRVSIPRGKDLFLGPSTSPADLSSVAAILTALRWIGLRSGACQLFY